MSIIVLIGLGNLVVWGVIIGLMFLMAARERNLIDDLADLEKRLDDRQ